MELHVHLEGSVQPELLLKLAQKNKVDLPVTHVQGLQEWFKFRDFAHFVEIYRAIVKCICDPEDIYEMACDFARHQASQNIVYSEVTYTALLHYRKSGILFEDQIAALREAWRWARDNLGVGIETIIDIPRGIASEEESVMCANWVIDHQGAGVAALGLGGDEANFPAELFASAFARVAEAGVPAVIHAGEFGGASSVRAALNILKAKRIGHGIRCLDDPELVAELRDRQIPLEVCPSSNIALNLVPDFQSHPIKQMLAEGLRVSINSDDPPLFGTTLTAELEQASLACGLSEDALMVLTRQAAEDTLLPATQKAELLQRIDGWQAAPADEMHGRL